MVEQIVTVKVFDFAIGVGRGYWTLGWEIGPCMVAKGVLRQGAVLLVVVVEAGSEEACCCAGR